jgi:hypothetical protein
MPPDSPDIDAEAPEVVADSSIVAQEYHRKPVATGIHGLGEIHDGERYPARVLVARAEDVHHVCGSQARTAVRIF